MGVAIGAANIFGIFEGGSGIEITNLAGDSAIVSGGVKRGDWPDPALSADEARPSLGKIIGQRGQGTKSRDHDASGAHGIGGWMEPTGRVF